MAKRDPHIADHLEWIGFVRPTGLVVSAPALVSAGVILNRRDAEGQQLLHDCVEEGDGESTLPDFRTFANRVLGWNFSPRAYVGTEEAPIPPELEATLPDSGGSLRPDFAVRMEPAKGTATPAPPLQVRDSRATYQTSSWQLLVCTCQPSEAFDQAPRHRSSSSSASDLSPHSRMERLLRETGTPAGLLFNGRSLRLISTPKGENSGWLEFRVGDMLQTAGRPISTAMRELLGQNRLLSVPREKRLAALLKNSRKYQNEVSERLAVQVLHGLYELLRGFQAAHDASKGELLRRALADQPEEVYRGLLTLILRLVFLLYTEERDMLPQDETFLGGYSLATLYQRLREDAALHPDTMDQRYGAYAQILVLSRMVHDGARCGAMQLPPRHGALFDPDRYRFLEGRGEQTAGARQLSERIEAPLVSDGTIYRVLEKLIVLDGERISYRALDVEHVGSVYETMMGFRLETATGRSVAIKAAKKQGAPATVDIDALLTAPPNDRAKWLQDRSDRKLTDRVKRAVRDCGTFEALLAALDAVIDKDATPDVVPKWAMILQPSEERRRSGSHYTPRELTEPIVRNTIGPLLSRLRDKEGGAPHPDQILDLKICDPAMGSGAFLVEACRQLGDALVEAWHAHDTVPKIPPDEDETTFARRQVAQRCLYGLDRNPTAVDLAKLSLWLVTLAKEHPLTFLDHALRAGDALVGLSREQILGFHWQAERKYFQSGIETEQIARHLRKVAELRTLIRQADDDVPDTELRDLWASAEYEAGEVTFLGDLVLAAFFNGNKAAEREALRSKYADSLALAEASQYRSWIEELRGQDPPLAPFHWEIEFPEAFNRDNPGFEAIVGNPPFAGKNSIAAANLSCYPQWLKQAHPESHGNADLVAHFFRRAFNLIREGGAFGLIATNTIAQGDTRSTGLRWICENGGEIYNARRRYKWPGLAAVVVSVLHVSKGAFDGPKLLDGNEVERITAFLFHRGGHGDPARLEANAGKSFQGSIVLGMGFTFDDTDKKGVATPLAEMRRLIEEEPRNQEVIFPYIGGEEVNSSPTHAHHRYVINFRDWPLRQEDVGATWQDADNHKRQDWLREGVVPLDYPEPVAENWPALLAIVERKVKPAGSVRNFVCEQFFKNHAHP
ncbi:MAG: N-6 DNA methylase, partial [Gammaproteobacteria bacterium]|nr:N-6 DNA methylase [Gammaproteobacteria bacterium]